ncbi:MAG: ABC transporter ATP-binding protein/permease [Alphaproteobacteria bacterium]|nr:ABC transporter ATP-binding protein/permease [Alphaproteobacteria bacterium]OJV47175.1 MAG: metal ABC transporter permease [Alphaproteobacteria bacterium 43-37]
MSSQKTIQTFLPYLWCKKEKSFRWRVIGAIIFLIIAKVTNPLVPVFLKKIVDALSTPQTAFVVVPTALILAYGLFRVLAQGFLELQNILFAKIGQHAIRRIANEVFINLHNLSLNFHLSRKTGGLSRSIERGTKSIETLLRMSLLSLVPSFFEILVVSIMLALIFDWRFAALIVATMALYIYVTMLTTHWRAQYLKRMNQSDDKANTKAIDSLLNYETVKYFNNESMEVKRFDDAFAKYEEDAVKNHLSLSALNVYQAIIISLGLIAFMALAGHEVVHGKMTVGDFVMVITFLLQLYIPLNFLGFAYRETKQSLINMSEIFALKDEEAEVKNKPNAKPLMFKNGSVRFDKVSFSYIPERPILKDVSFTLAGGKTVAIVGPSGAGKSTIARLLYRFYIESKGSIFIDNQNLADCTLDSIRKIIGVIPQDTVLFNDSLYYNILYGRPDATYDEVVAASKQAQLDAFISRLPEGYDTQVGERGLKLSGGEKQRVAIARTILKNPKIFIFDEATSALDTHTEKAIQESLRIVSWNRTTLIIAHRLSTITHADLIVVLEKGEVVEQGTHDELLKLNSAYASLWNKQNKRTPTKQGKA